MLCPKCNEEKEIQTPGKYAQVLICGHIITHIPTSEIINRGASATQAQEIQKKLEKTETLPVIDTQEVTTRALSSMKKNYEEFFTSENQLIEDLIKEHGKDKAILLLTSIHSHMSHVLFTMSRFRNLYIQHIESLKKEIEDKAVKELIQNHDFYYKDLDHTKKPKKIKTITSQGDTIAKAKENLKGLTDKDGKPLDMMKVFGSLMWKDPKVEEEKKKEKEDYKKGLESIAASIFAKKDDSQ